MTHNRSAVNTPVSSRATTPAPNTLNSHQSNDSSGIDIKRATNLSLLTVEERALPGSCIRS